MKPTLITLIIVIFVLLIVFVYMSKSRHAYRYLADPPANALFSWGKKDGKCRTIADKSKWIEYRDVVDKDGGNSCYFYFCDKDNKGPFEPPVCGMSDAPAKYMGCYLHERDGQRLSGDDTCKVPSNQPNPSAKLTRTSRMCNLAWSNTIGKLDTLHTLVQPTSNDAVVLLDGFDASASDVAKWKAQGKIVIGYISVGSWEDWRPDAKQWPKETIGPRMADWDGEKWINLSQWQKLEPIMKARLTMLKNKGFQGYEGDNISVDVSGKRSREYADENIAYGKWLAETAHSMGLLAVLKNADDFVKTLEPSYDAVIKEEALRYDEADNFYIFLDKNKPVWIFEYPGDEGKNPSDEVIQQKLDKTKQKIADKKIRATQILFETRRGYVTLL